MKIRILGTESLGVRGLSCVVETRDRKIFIDPGIALGIYRNGLKPHPVQIGVGRIIRERIVQELQDATDIVISHLHGDHIPLFDANPYQLSVEQVKDIPSDCRIWINGDIAYSNKMEIRQKAFVLGLGRSSNEAEGKVDELMTFLGPVSHGEDSVHNGNVMMTMVDDGDSVFIHASDIQMFSEDTVDEIIRLKPDIVLASGPPIYLTDRMKDKKEIVWKNSLKLAGNAGTLILDHHLLRCDEGIVWIEKLSELSGNRVMCAADFMGIERHMLEAWRSMLYEDIPVQENWHEMYEKNETHVDEYMDKAREIYEWFGY
ncbi:Predicted hydrolase of the metallo-beta-lactamase superfamily [Dethiosulfatibacter aminovorans DSM 17477]|uniref:Predicted hydrolase of the metallo-beta-lactamase superfamily n=1 Tax=Dethiosulfatibacter aminovorans DSM 17477 TaxID=1121476 RepID=A0A1M6KZU7_9FIRM|nr:hypothetical protein [Dethiosulfatibacter aminovorans]SHJ64513.1 Predicted hydrolase of the metallo-beta-lactamase superfamily [Dethiosulfatibacter aminovorans DSM 17477]